MKYPFSPDILDALPETMAEHFRTLELDLIKRICEQLKTGQPNQVSVQSLQGLKSHGISLREIRKVMKQFSGLTDKQITALFNDVVKRNQKYQASLLDIAKVTKPDKMLSLADFAVIEKQTRQTMQNIAQSMAFIVNNGQMLPAANAYQWVIDQAIIEVQSGTTSYNQAIKRAVKQLADSGLRFADYDSGHIDHADVAARRAVMTGIAQINARFNEQSIEYLDTDLVEVSAHNGARNVGEGYENHESWQGKVYRWSAKTNPNNPQSTGDYPDFVEVCGYGFGGGIEGWNCRHSFYPFVEGVSERTYTDADLQKLTAKQFTYQGKQYDTYKATQKQREIERTIRKLTRQNQAFSSAGIQDAADATNAKIRALKAEYKAFSQAADLPMQAERMRVLKGF